MPVSRPRSRRLLGPVSRPRPLKHRVVDVGSGYHDPNKRWALIPSSKQGLAIVLQDRETVRKVRQ